MSVKINLNDLAVVKPEVPGKAFCKLCNAKLGDRRDNFIRHYKSQHPDALANIGEKFILIKHDILNKEEYIENIIEIMVTCNMPFTVWNKKAMKRNQNGFMKEFGLTCSAKFMSELLAAYAIQVRQRIKVRLQNR